MLTYLGPKALRLYAFPQFVPRCHVRQPLLFSSSSMLRKSLSSLTSTIPANMPPNLPAFEEPLYLDVAWIQNLEHPTLPEFLNACGDNDAGLALQLASDQEPAALTVGVNRAIQSLTLDEHATCYLTTYNGTPKRHLKRQIPSMQSSCHWTSGLT